MDGPAHGIIECGTSADVVLFVGHGFYFVDIHLIMKQFIFIIEKDRRNLTVALHGLLFLQHGIETADSIRFQSSHGTTPVKNKYEFSSVVFICKDLLSCLVIFIIQNRKPLRVASQATNESQAGSGRGLIHAEPRSGC